MQELMIHAWHDKYLEMDLNNYILSFDDGLYSQVDGIKKIVQKFPDVEIRYYVSTGLINVGGYPRTYNESDVAHRIFQETGNTGDFVSYDDLLELSKISNVTIGLHGHMHLDLQHLQRNYSLADQFKIWDEDILKMLFSTIQLVQQKIIDPNIIHLCMPYNQDFPLYVATFRKKFSVYFPEAEFVVTGAGRVNINNLPLAPTFIERYNILMNEAQQKIVSAMRVPPEYFVGSKVDYGVVQVKI